MAGSGFPTLHANADFSSAILPVHSKPSFGISTHQWLIQHRIDHAKELMSDTTMSLIDIAIQSGFNDQPAFTRTFHQLVGVSPGRWRRHYTTRHSRT